MYTDVRPSRPRLIVDVLRSKGVCEVGKRGIERVAVRAGKYSIRLAPEVEGTEGHREAMRGRQ
jgi:hypothetical protein